jgi:elongation factor G
MRADPVLLEPVMAVEVLVPESHMGDVIGDLNSKGHGYSAWNQSAETFSVLAHVPMAEMTHYATALRSITQGEARLRCRC